MIDFSKIHLSNEYINGILFTITVLVISYIISMIVRRFIDAVFSQVKHRIDSERVIARTRTIRNLFKNVIQTIIFIMAVLIILSRWDINIAPILTGAGILGLAVSFGAQTFIKDVFSGIFIILEDQFHIGDRVLIGDKEGVVVNISLRVTILIDDESNYIYIPNSTITTLVRYGNEGKIKKLSKRKR